MNNAQVHGCPLEGWVCFHCGELFTTVGAAADHFGTTPDRQPACMIKLGDELGLVMALRKAEEERDALAAHMVRQDALLAEHFEEWEADTGDWDEFNWHDRVARCREDEPTISLARRDLMKQAEGAEMVRDRLREKAGKARSKCDQPRSAFYHRCANVAANKADELRRQAEGGGS